MDGAGAGQGIVLEGQVAMMDGPLGIGLAAYIDPAVGLLHVLLAVGFPLGPVRAGLEEAGEGLGTRRVLVIDVAVKLLRRRPSQLVVLAVLVVTLEGTAVGLGMLVQVTVPGELLSTVGTHVGLSDRLVFNLSVGLHGACWDAERRTVKRSKDARDDRAATGQKVVAVVQGWVW